MNLKEARQIAVNQAVLEKIFGTGGAPNPTPQQRDGYISDCITVTPEDTETTSGTIVFSTKIVTAAYDMESDLESIEQALGTLGVDIAGELNASGVANMVLNGFRVTARSIRDLQEQATAVGDPEPIQAVFQSKSGATYAVEVQVEGSLSVSEEDDAGDEWAEISAEVNCAGVDFTGQDMTAAAGGGATGGTAGTGASGSAGSGGTATATITGTRVTKKITGKSNPRFQPISFKFTGSVQGSGQELSIKISLWRSAATNGAATISTVSGVRISNVQVNLQETGGRREPVWH